MLDTDICVYATKNSYPLLLGKLLGTDPDEVFISSITVGEMEYGCSKSNWADRSRAVMNMFLSAIPSCLSMKRTAGGF